MPDWSFAEVEEAIRNLILDASEEVEGKEILVVEATVDKRKIRLINGYGPQESQNEETRRNFYSRLDFEIRRAKISGTLILIEMDSSAKLGYDIIPDDPTLSLEMGKC